MYIHVHACEHNVFLQMLHQHQTLAEIGALLREQLVSVEAMKRFISYSRCAAYPHFQQIQKEQMVAANPGKERTEWNVFHIRICRNDASCRAGSA